MCAVTTAPYLDRMTTLEIRPLTPRDWPHVWPMLRDMGFVDSKEQLRERFPAFCARVDWGLLGAERGGQLLAYAAVQDHGTDFRSGNTHRTARLHDLFTVEGARGQGLARALMLAVEEWGRRCGVRHVEWYANTRVAAIYERMGYTGRPSGQEGSLFFSVDLR